MGNCDNSPASCSPSHLAPPHPRPKSALEARAWGLTRGREVLDMQAGAGVSGAGAV